MSRASIEYFFDNPDAQIPGEWPARTDTVSAEFLAALLEGEKVTDLDPRFAQPTKSAASIVRHLNYRYGWRIQSSKFAYCTDDGRLAFAKKYCLLPGVIKSAYVCDAEEWIDGVRTAGKIRLASARRVEAQANIINAWYERGAQGATT
ncbi:hypothetical protein PQQ65_03505 [Paraburkholderia strydomiana]|uniref:hypothetical protein n=1 Tax=Paraburkholderia strydomiana TaxID=1245417 RepID=UPI0038B77BD0